MTDNIDISKARDLVNPNQLVNVETMHSLQKVSEEIQQVKADVASYQKNVESLQPPIVNGEPWYKFAFGKASVTAVNTVMESFSTFVQETFKEVAKCQKLQNENDMNICRLVGLLAMAEANSYEKLNILASDIKDMSTEDEESARQLKELEKSFLQSLDDSAIDSTKKEEQMSRLIDYVTLFAESKTKKIRSISLNLSEIKAKLDKYCTTQENWVSDAKDAISLWQNEVNNNLTATKQQLEETLNKITKEKHGQLDDSFGRLKESFEEAITKQEDKINQEQIMQNVKIEASTKSIEEKMSEYKSIIENQTSTIASQNKLLKNHNVLICALRKKINIALFIGIISIFLIIGIMTFLFIQ